MGLKDKMTEAELQKQLAQMLDLLGWQWCHVPNGGKRSITEAVKFRSQGVKAGVPDILIFEAWEGSGDSGHGVALELKSDQGRISRYQKQWLERLDDRGWLVGVCRTIDECMQILQHVKPRNRVDLVRVGNE